jgi:serine/threonine protein kinase
VTAPSDAALDRLRRVVARPEVPDRYALDAPIGRGGMGEVWRARDHLLDRDVAIKVIAPGLTAPDLVRRLEREALVLARLEHPGIVAVHDAGTLPDGRAYYVMRLVRGERLDEYAATPRGVGELLRTFVRIVEPVTYAHAHGILHRDLKPANVMLGPFGEVLVMDWGIAQLPGAAATPGMVLGTPGFMAPEQAAGEPVDARADVYGLGAILRTLVSGRHDVPRPLTSIVRRATADAPSGRYRTVAELGADVRAFLDGEPVSAHREQLPERIGRFVRRHRVAILLFSAYIIMRALILALRGI